MSNIFFYLIILQLQTRVPAQVPRCNKAKMAERVGQETGIGLSVLSTPLSPPLPT